MADTQDSIDLCIIWHCGPFPPTRSCSRVARQRPGHFLARVCPSAFLQPLAIEGAAPNARSEWSAI
eukprot:3441154-Pyramimonas_sp.AAC.1